MAQNAGHHQLLRDGRNDAQGATPAQRAGCHSHIKDAAQQPGPETSMRFYTTQHPFYCGIDLHARTLYICILDQGGKVLVHRNMKTDPETFLKAIAPYRPGLVVAVECMFTWYWLADLCADEEIPFVLGHAL
jgi:hypothetical protein